MNKERLPDGRPPRRDDSTTRASAHPELIHGDIAMRPPSGHLSLAPVSAALSGWSTRKLLLCGLAAIVVGVSAHSSFTHDLPSKARIAQVHEQKLPAACLKWHQAASAVLARLAGSTRDSDLRQINDVVFRMRRALRNCEAGWLALACQDYHAVTRNLHGRINMHEESLIACGSTAGSGSAAAIP